jgi:aryl-alcohol dehydrogenase-like predicted oxidoreductase
MADLAARLKQEGKIRAFGIATGVAECSEILRSRAIPIDILQFPRSLFAQDSPAFPADENPGTITHSPFQRQRPPTPETWSAIGTHLEEAGLDAKAPGILDDLALAYARHVNSNGIVLCGMATERHIRRNVEIFAANLFPPALLGRVAALIADGRVPKASAE